MSLPLDKNKYSSEPFFNPGDFIGYIRRLDRLGDRPAPEAVILSYQRSLFDYAANEVASTPAGAYFGKQLRYLEETDGKVAIVGNFGVGAPAAVVMLEELIAFGVKRFVSVGTAGSLVLDLPPGSLLLCDGAFRDEGCSYHYLPEAELAAPDPRLTEKLGEALSARGLAYRRGPAWTTDAIYRETKDEVEFFRGKGALVAEMEAAALFSAAAFRKVQMASCFSVSDTLAEMVWRPEFHAETTKDGLKQIFEAAVTTLSD